MECVCVWQFVPKEARPAYNFQALQQNTSTSLNPLDLSTETGLLKELHDLHLAEDLYWCQRARSNWLQHEDKNTSSFQL